MTGARIGMSCGASKRSISRLIAASSGSVILPQAMPRADRCGRGGGSLLSSMSWEISRGSSRTTSPRKGFFGVAWRTWTTVGRWTDVIRKLPGL